MMTYCRWCLAVGMGRAALLMQATQQVRPPQQKQQQSSPKQVGVVTKLMCLCSDDSTGLLHVCVCSAKYVVGNNIVLCFDVYHLLYIVTLYNICYSLNNLFKVKNR